MSAPKVLPPIRIVHCDKCGCSYKGGCPDETHPGYRAPDPPEPPPTQRPAFFPGYGLPYFSDE